jgi:hypothetical protein
MKLFHGSPIKNLKVITQTESDPGNFEGKAIYLTDSFSVAKDYATDYQGHVGSVYEVDPVEPLLDLSSKDLINNFIEKSLEPLNIQWNTLSWTDAAINHLLNHHGKNGIWSLHLDVAVIFKFEPSYKTLTDLKDLESRVQLAIQKSLNAFCFYAIADSSNRAKMYILKTESIKVSQEFTFI